VVHVRRGLPANTNTNVDANANADGDAVRRLRMKRTVIGLFMVLAIAMQSCDPAYAQLSYKQIGASATGSAGGAIAATLAAPSNGTTNYIEEFSVTCPAPASNVSGVVTVTGLAIGTMSYELTETTNYGAELIIPYYAPEMASAVNAAIAVNVPAIASGSACTVTAVGRQY
jgi:hypothetical protein